ncbi:Signal transduction histidine kinase [Rhizobium sp. RU35A]|uniref:histidine kinase n=1 Tax=Rhizobium straminoryzae TaxID=1387186 RepID=A0A549TBE1_9HYPH|nr:MULTISPECIES: ATP-binding protein [Rhizobium]TRL39203.1 HAMP domain-containing protein [Rhizobium straminoryzae]SIQ38130.1 Signal transduction histidine kinase [Rhizobium sp. RU35A]
MKSLYHRIAALLVLSIVSVVGLATFVASRVLEPPDAHDILAPVVSQMRLTLALVETDPAKAATAGARLDNRLPDGQPHARLSEALVEMLAADDIHLPSEVIKTSETPPMMAAVRTPDGAWAVFRIPHRAPPSDWLYILGGWMLLIVLGSLAISFFIASKITRPLELLEGAAESIGKDGLLPPIPEKGSREVRATARALNRLSSRLRSALESRMRLVAAAGHDLRTPMTRMRLRAEFISGDDERAKWLSDLEELDSIADSAIGLVREETSDSGPELIRLDIMVRLITEELAKLGFAIELSSAADATVPAQPMALKRALRNLVINAATHGGGGRWRLETTAKDAVLTIEDGGPGIPEDLLGQVFEPFFRVDPARRKTAPGAGLGLAIAKEIVNRFGGDIDIANRPAGGLVQTVRLPLSA